MAPFSQFTHNLTQLVELKTGETFNGHMIACDNFMNVTMKEVYQTSEDGSKFWKMEEAYLRGNNIKYIRVADAVSWLSSGTL